jgi:CheY-like chemotaxis protein
MDTILIVDDDAAIREIFTIYLDMGGYRIITATNGRECMDILKTQIPDLILLDMMMEPMDGWETLLAIRSCPASCYIPVIIITGKQPVPQDILEFGGLIEDFIVKPVDFKLIVPSLHRIIEKDKDLGREIDRIKGAGQETELLNEYTRLLRLVRVSHSLKKRLKDSMWTDRAPLKKQEERLQHLHKKMGFPDSLLEWEVGG